MAIGSSRFSSSLAMVRPGNSCMRLDQLAGAKRQAQRLRLRLDIAQIRQWALRRQLRAAKRD
eukprot:1105912-Prorocentrum_lima.AAC.1